MAIVNNHLDCNNIVTLPILTHCLLAIIPLKAIYCAAVGSYLLAFSM